MVNGSSLLGSVTVMGEGRQEQDLALTQDTSRTIGEQRKKYGIQQAVTAQNFDFSPHQQCDDTDTA